MKIRDGRRVLHDMLASPAHIDGHYAFNTNAIASEPFVAPVERRFLTPVELARIHEQQPVPYLPPVTVAERSAAMAVARSRGGKATAEQHRKLRPLMRDDEILWDALRKSRGNVTYAAEIMERDRATVRQNLIVRQRRGTVPPDVAWLLEHPKRRPTTPTGTHRHTPVARALIALGVRAFHARKRAAA